MSTDETEPKGSASSSLDDFCGWCKHHRRYHEPELCTVCPAFTTDNHHAFVPAAGETAGEPCQCGHSLLDHQEPEGSFKGQCDACFNSLSERLGRTWIHDFVPAEPKGPEDPSPDECRSMRTRGVHCFEHGPRCCNCGVKQPEPADTETAGEPEAPPRPPYAVAYATGSGALNEIALPGDAMAAVTDGALVISHPSGVLGIVHVKPWEGRQ